MIINRLKQNESTLCTYTTTGEEIKEGHILGYGDNYPCIVLYDKFEGKFVVLEFGYKDEGYLYRNHDIQSYTCPWTILGHIDNFKEYKKYLYGKYIPRYFDYTKDVEEYYEDHLELEEKAKPPTNFLFVKEEDSITEKIIKNTKSW